MIIFDFKKKKADKLHAEARQMHDEGKDDEAIVKYLEVIDLDPDKSETYYNLGLIYKYRGEWQKSFDFNQKANALNPEEESARWNLAIAATALRNWAVARTIIRVRVELNFQSGHFLGQDDAELGDQTAQSVIACGTLFDEALPGAVQASIPMVHGGKLAMSGRS